MAEDQWLSRKEAARRAGVHYNVVRDWERKGLVEWKKAGSAQNAEILVEVASLDRHLSTRSARRMPESEARERVAALEAEVRELRVALAKSETERRELPDHMFGRLERKGPARLSLAASIAASPTSPVQPSGLSSSPASTAGRCRRPLPGATHDVEAAHRAFRAALSDQIPRVVWTGNCRTLRCINTRLNLLKAGVNRAQRDVNRIYNCSQLQAISAFGENPDGGNFGYVWRDDTVPEEFPTTGLEYDPSANPGHLGDGLGLLDVGETWVARESVASLEAWFVTFGDGEGHGSLELRPGEPGHTL